MAKMTSKQIERTSLPPHPPNITTIPAEVELLLFEQLGVVTSTCLGLTCKKFYAIHKAMHGKVSLTSVDYELPVTIISMPPEIMHMIATDLTTADVASLSLTCRDVYKHMHGHYDRSIIPLVSMEYCRLYQPWLHVLLFDWMRNQQPELIWHGGSTTKFVNQKKYELHDHELTLTSPLQGSCPGNSGLWLRVSPKFPVFDSWEDMKRDAERCLHLWLETRDRATQ
ncbi:hypothetical protein BJ878DRAFT_257251 [Calycina marina]|uniref:F-box domain-containing protein n=1 Tax=Calycina marina TaxID=1763456 RepID=A0A9P8CBU0_9HELO|nr:hypothetical protein BJ878DRAFT_257251 [Calycina marina]